MIGTGRLQGQEVRHQGRAPTSSATTSYWGGRPPLDGVKITFYQGSAPLVLALRAGQIDLAMQLSPQEALPFKNNKKYTYYQLPTSAHRQVCMRTDQALFKDPRVRRAVALVINRPQQLEKIMLGAAAVGNDNPFWSDFASTDPSIKQRTQNVNAGEGVAAGGRGAEPEVHHHHVELPRPHRPRGVHPGLRARRGHRGGHRGDGRLQVLRLGAGRGGLRDHDAVAEPHLHTDGVRGPRGAERLPHPRLHVDRDRRLERIALQQPRVRLGREDVPRLRPTSRRSARRPSGWRGCSSATRP